MIEDLLKSSYIELFLKHFEEKSSLLLEELWEAPKALLLLVLSKATGRNILVLSGGDRQTQLIDDLGYFSQQEIHHFPAWETLPGEEIKPSPDIVGKRFSILSKIQGKSAQILITDLQGALQKVLPPKLLSELNLEIKIGDEIDFASLPSLLTKLGYRRESVAADKGEFALRGGILDIFPVAAFDPYRIDFFGDTVDRIRIYDPIGQRSQEKRTECLITPAEEHQLLKQHHTTLIDYLGNNPILVLDDLLKIEDRFVTLKSLSAAQSPLFSPFKSFLSQCKKRLYFSQQNVNELGEVKREKESVSFEIFEESITTSRTAHPFLKIEHVVPHEEGRLLQEILAYKPKGGLHFITASEAEEKSLREKITETGTPLPPLSHFHRGYLTSGFGLGDIVVFPYTDLTKRYKVHREKQRTSYHTPASEFHQLDVGDLVVHFHNGIGKYLGIEKQKDHTGATSEFFIIEYAKGSKLYVPIAQSHLISRYIGAHEEKPMLHTLGTKNWQRAKEKTQKAILGYAKDLLHMHAEREVKGGFIYPADSEETLLFEEEFPFVETDDQLQAIAAIKEDMTSNKAMDRLICGDVGYGKTEVAMRAAFKAVVDGQKQVAIMVPTTVLAMQHYETFCERMAQFPITVKLISRFNKPKEVKETLEGLKQGSVDILIGTHRLISKDVQFKSLGLIVIDEEQRFGVRAKERLKKIKVGVDCLTLSATPIPRTLYFSLLGARDMSVINTPPQDRLPIKTILAEHDREIIKAALMREIAHGGQAYFIHNRVESIFRIAKELQDLIPNARVDVVHGQMSSDEIDMAFHQFKSGATQILVATSIVENGIDIPNANTILIDRSDRFGISDLYQLRGRVGRWNKPAFAYFLTPKNLSLPEISRKRLRALVETSGFGGGIKLAMRDLEIRGAGDILGTQQSGQVSSIGFHLYCKLLKRTIEALKKEETATFFETKMEFSFPAYLPEDYIEETSLRLEFYHRLGEAVREEELDDLLVEMEDRFGKPPEPLIFLHHLTRLRLFASKNHITSMKFGKRTLDVERLGKKTQLTLPPWKTPSELEKAVKSGLALQM